MFIIYIYICSLYIYIYINYIYIYKAHAIVIEIHYFVDPPLDKLSNNQNSLRAATNRCKQIT